MVKINENFAKLPGGYLFPEIGRRVRAFSAENPPLPLIRLGIGDVTQPLAPAVIEAMEKATAEMGKKETFRGYCEEVNAAYDFLRYAIRDDYKLRGVEIEDDEIFVSDGAKSDCGNIGDIFGVDNVVAVCDPVYPVYVDTNAMAGRAGDYDGEKWTDLVYLPCTAENGFFPDLPADGKVPDMIYICSPNNPTGAVATREQLQTWVDYANKHGSVILPLSSAPSPRLPALPVTAAPIPSFPRSWSGTASVSTACGTAVRAPSSTACPMSFSGLRRPPLPKRAGSRFRRPLPFT